MILNYTASKDTYITNAFFPNLITRASSSNFGRSDILDVWSLYGQSSSSTEGLSQELSRILVEFPISNIITDRNSGKIPQSGSISFFLMMYNTPHSETTPRGAVYDIFPLSESWAEGEGLSEMSKTYSTLSGATWMSRSNNLGWTDIGGTYITSSNTAYQTYQRDGTENIEIDLTSLVESWINGSISNNGIILKLTGSQEGQFSSSLGSNSGSLIHNPNGGNTSFYRKTFFSRTSEHFFKRPKIQARWNDSQYDDRGNFFYSSSRATSEDNLNTLYYYNYIRGKLTNIPNLTNGTILVSLYSGSNFPTGSKLLLSPGGGVVSSGDTEITGGIVNTGIYTASFCATASSSPLETIFDVLHSGGVEYFTGSFEPKKFENLQTTPTFEYFSKITNLKSFYNQNEIGRFRIYSRLKNFSPTVYNVARNVPETLIINSASYEIYRVHDNYPVIPFGTGSDLHTLTSYDMSGNYFDVDFSVLEPGYMYGIKLAYYNHERNSWDVQRENWKFRIE